MNGGIDERIPDRGDGGRRPLVIAFFVTYFPKLSEVFILNQAVELERRGHRVVFYALASVGESARQPSSEAFLGSGKIGRMPARPVDRWARLPMIVARMRFHDVRRGLSARRYGAEALTLRNLYRLDTLGAEVIDCDVAHAQFGHVGRQCLFLRHCGRLDAPLVTSFRGNDLSGYLRRARPNVYEPLFRASAACLPVSVRWAAQLVDLGCDRSKIHPLPSGIPMDRVPTAAREAGPIRLVSAARLERYKGIHLGIEAFHAVTRKCPEAVYEVFGEGPERPALEARTRTLGIANRVRWRGAVPHQELLEALAQCHIHLFTTVTSAAGRTEGVPNILKESQAVGLPTVAFRHPGVDEVVDDGETGYLVPEGDTSGMADHAVKLIEDPSLATSMGTVASERARRRFDLQGLTDQLEEIYYAVRGRPA